MDIRDKKVGRIHSVYRIGFKSAFQLPLLMIIREDYEAGELLGAVVLFNSMRWRKYL